MRMYGAVFGHVPALVMYFFYIVCTFVLSPSILEKNRIIIAVGTGRRPRKIINGIIK